MESQPSKNLSLNALRRLVPERVEVTDLLDSPADGIFHGEREKSLLELAEEKQEKIYKEREQLCRQLIQNTREQQLNASSSSSESSSESESEEEFAAEFSNPLARHFIIPRLNSKFEEPEVITFRTEPTIPLPIVTDKRGILEKKNPYGIWQNRYVVVKDFKLKYYQVGEKWQPIGCLNFNQHPFEIEMVGKREETRIFRILPSGVDKVFLFRAESHKEMMRWYDHIRRQIENSIAKKYPWRNLAPVPHFWKVRQPSN